MKLSSRGGRGRYALAAALLLTSTPLLTVAQDSAQEAEDENSLSTVESLLRLFDTTRGFEWRNRTGWLDPSVPNPCDWYGIECYTDADGIDMSGHIRTIDLSDNKLRGVVPQDIYDLPFLESFTVRDNSELDVTMVGIAKAEYLKTLVMSNTGLLNLNGIRHAPALEYIHVTDCEMNGEFPSEITEIDTLKGFYGNYAGFTGTLPTKLGYLRRLEEIYLYQNELTGTIPSEIGFLKNLKVLALAQNEFSGTLPYELSNLVNLRILAIQREYGKEKGPGITGTLPLLRGMKELREVYLENQRLNGTVPEDFLRDSGDPKEKLKVDLMNNNLEGRIHSTLDVFDFLTIFLTGNKITEISSRDCGQDGWMDGNVGKVRDAGQEGCDAILCPVGKWNEYGRALPEEPCKDCSDTLPYMGSWECLNPDRPKTQLDVLSILYDALEGDEWQDNRGWMSDDHECTWHGISCTESKNIKYVDLKDNGLKGTVPHEIFQLPFLERLDLMANDIDFKFDGIDWAEALKYLYLSNTGLSSTENIEQLKDLTELRELRISQNNLKGKIPPTIFELSSLQYLSISHNQFTGTLHTEIGNLNKLTEFHAYGNRLTGQIPTEVGNIGPQLEMLVLSENDFGGTLPPQIDSLTGLQTLSIHQTTKDGDGIKGTMPAFENLRQLDVLHLNSNSIGGKLPPNFLRNSNKLSANIEVDLSDNAFTGPIPSDWTRFGNLDLYLNDNMIDSFGENICQKSGWMGGAVGAYGCDAILCPDGEYNEFGRRTSKSQCQQCSAINGAPFYGSTKCEGKSTGGEQRVDERDILEKFYYSLAGTEWDYNDGWTTEPNVCDSWFGISCDDEGHVTKIELSSNSLTGKAYNGIFGLPMLRELDLQDNDITFDFFGIDLAENLHTIYLSDTGIHDLNGIGDAKALRVFHCTSNNVEELPDDIFRVTTLERLYLNYNRISGWLSSKVGNLKNLEELYLMHNRMDGQIPASIGDLAKLRVLALTENNFHGTLPDELNKLTSMEVLAIQREGGLDNDGQAGGADVGTNQGESQKQGGGITGPLISFNNLPNLKELYLGSNSLTGTIPYDFLDGIDNKVRGVTVDLVGNQLTGTVPGALAQFEAMTLYIAGNEFEAIAQGLCSKSDWMGGDMGRYGCKGLLCPPNYQSVYGRQSDDDTRCEECTGGRKARYYGSFECVGDSDFDGQAELTILRKFYDETGGSGWTLSTNWKTDDDFCNWHGVQCVSDNVRSVQGLRLPQNGLTGRVPREVYDLPNLQELNFGGNKVKVDFFGIDKASKLSYLNLDATGLTSLDGLENGQTIKLLHVMGNNFGGSLPSSILYLQDLEVLYLSDNDVGTTLPDSLKTLSNLVYLQCFDCGLSGPIPKWFSDLPNLEYLRLSQNSLTGDVPEELANCAKLEHLDLSDQISHGGTGLTGNLPKLAGMEKISELYLNKNNIVGDIPPDFLPDVDTSLDVKIDLRNNKITGQVPEDLARIRGLSLYLSNNMIAGIANDICQLDFAGSYGCDGVLCPSGTFNSLGRKTDSDAFCSPCGVAGHGQFFGETDCDTSDQKSILEKFYYDLRGGQWEVNDGWVTADSVCDWFGVTCTDDREFVIGITLEDNGMKGLVPKDIFSLPRLESLKLKKNDIEFSFDGIGSAVYLHTLSLSETSLTRLDGIGMAKDSLKYLHLTNNNLGQIPDEIYQLANLEDLYMNYNEISSSLSTKIGLLTNLKNLFLFHNKITGSLPTELGNLKNLKVLALGENYLSGEIPTELNRLTNIEIIALQREAGETAPGIGGPLEPKSDIEVGKGFTGLLPPFDGLPKIRELYLGSNSLHGEIPNEFLSSADKSAVIKVDLTMNDLEGEFPDFLKEFGQMKMYAAGNRFNGMAQSLCSKDNWMGGEVSVSGCNAILCPPGTFNIYGRAASAETPCEDCPYTYEADFYGSIECLPTHTETYSDKEVLQLFYEATGGPNWAHQNYWMDNNTPICQWHGVSCDGGGNKVTGLELPSNNLGGTVPPVLFQLENLEELNLRDNPVDSEFKGIEKAASLKHLYLDSTKLTSLEGIGKATKLETLHLQQNNFYGESIPGDIFSLTNMRHLYLSDSLFGGTLPAKIAQLTQLEEFYCHGNELTGTIPSEIAQLNQLQVLVLSENNIIGTIPTEMNAMAGLKSLFIDSFTKQTVGLSGPVPDFAGAANLREIYLNSNGLTGTVPANLLSGLSDMDQVITVGLQSNQITGTVPGELKRFSKLNIDLAGNQITAIDGTLCAMGSWMSGLVNKFKCDAILCPPETFNQHGRQYNEDSDCVPCLGDGDDKDPYYGSLMCESEEKKKEKEILKQLYNTCGGTKWKNRDNWMRDDVDICHWYGISCHESRLVDSIILGSNNLVGTPPKQIFEMTELKWLWLYANPINFKFDGIGSAPKLTSLLLDSTGLTSLDGVEYASVLEDLDVRFNNLQGELPSGFAKLVNLKSFACSDNELSGHLPSFSTLKRLERLRMGGNRFSGPLQDYATNAQLKSMDLSGNYLTGTIPSSFLKNADKSQSIYIDLSSNELTGMVPAEFDFFNKMTLYLRDNKITGIDPTLCDNDAWNDGDVESFQCDAILCPQGTYAPNDGRASRAGSQCIPCNKAIYFGASQCGGVSTKNPGSVAGLGWMTGLAGMAVAILCW